MRTRAATPSVTAAMTRDTTSPSRTPPRTPSAATASPPNVGAITIGTRRSTDCTVNPIVRLSGGSASPTTANSVGLAMLSHAITSASATSATGHAGSRR